MHTCDGHCQFKVSASPSISTYQKFRMIFSRLKFWIDNVLNITVHANNLLTLNFFLSFSISMWVEVVYLKSEYANVRGKLLSFDWPMQFECQLRRYGLIIFIDQKRTLLQTGGIIKCYTVIKMIQTE